MVTMQLKDNSHIKYHIAFILHQKHFLSFSRCLGASPQKSMTKVTFVTTFVVAQFTIRPLSSLLLIAVTESKTWNLDGKI